MFRYILLVFVMFLVGCEGGGSSDEVVSTVEVVEVPKEIFDYDRARELILGSKYLPIDYPDKVEAYPGADFLAIAPRGVDVLTITTDGEVSNPLVLWPTNPNNRLMIYHGGHGQDTNSVESLSSIAKFLEEGYTVLAFEMPIGDHGRFSTYTAPLRPFIQPVIVGLNYMMGQGAWDVVAMSGLSGGGWTTHLVAAIDHRITHSYPVAGSIPLDLRSGGSVGDFEQTEPELYKEFGYRDLYVMAADNNRRQIQILNSDDSCCFQGDTYAPLYQNGVVSRALAQTGYWDVIVVTEIGHTINEEAMSLILEDLNK